MLPGLAVSNLRRVSPLLFSARKAHWNYQWQAGPYPKTEAERVAAAKKYGMLPEEYEPYDDDGLGWGDYPKLPLISKNNVDHWFNYTCPEERRNFGEPVHILDVVLQEDRGEFPITDPGVWKTPFWKQYLYFCLYFFGGIGLMYYTNDVNPILDFQPKCAWPYPEEGKKHYKWNF